MRHGHWTGIMIVLCMLAARPAKIEGCTCVTQLPGCPAVTEADAIFEATVDSIETEAAQDRRGRGPFERRVVRLRDVHAWRGHPQDVVITGMGGGDCGYQFRVGTRYAIVAYRNVEDGRLGTGICSMTQPLDEAAGLREYVQSLSAPSRGGHIWGRVATGARWVDAYGPDARELRLEPIASVRVSVSGPVARAFTTGSDGQFSFTALPPGQYTIRAETPADRRDLAVIRPRTVTLEGAYACADADLWGSFAGGFEGTVVYEDGTPAPGVHVLLHSAAGPPHPAGSVIVSTKTDAGGRYRLADLAPGRYVAGVSIMDGPTASEPFAIAYGRSRDGGLELVMPESVGTIHVEPIVARRLTPVHAIGTVYWSDGAPASGFEVLAVSLGDRGPIAAFGSPVKTAMDGGFAIDLFRGARYRLSVRRDSRVVERVEIVASDQPMTITLRVP